MSNHPPQHTSSALLWRYDRVEFHSDWTFTVIEKDETGQERGSDNYYIHRVKMTTGTRFSVFFKEAMKEQDICTVVELHPYMAKFVPNMLDYLYADTDEEAGSLLNLSTESATALYALGNFFQIEQIKIMALSFCQQDVALSNIKHYYSQGKALQTAETMAHVRKAAATAMQQLATPPTTNTMISIKSNNNNNRSQNSHRFEEDRVMLFSLAHVADLKFWIPVFDINRRATVESDSDVSNLASLIVVEAWQCAREPLSMDDISQATSALLMPSVHVDAALTLLFVEKLRLDQNKAVDNVGTLIDVVDLTPLQQRASQALQSHFVVPDGSKEPEVDLPSPTPEWAPTNLQERCIEALGRDWDKVDYSDKKVEWMLARLENPWLISRIATHSLGQAKKQRAERKPRFPLGRVMHKPASNNNSSKQHGSENVRGEKGVSMRLFGRG